MIDFHSHILPAMDDGSRNIEESLQMLRMLQEQGVERVIATLRSDTFVFGFGRIFAPPRGRLGAFTGTPHAGTSSCAFGC